MNHPNPKASPPDTDTLDELYSELLILKICIYGMLHIISEFDTNYYQEISSAASIQLHRFENVVKRLN